MSLYAASFPKKKSQNKGHNKNAVQNAFRLKAESILFISASILPTTNDRATSRRLIVDCLPDANSGTAWISSRL